MIELTDVKIERLIKALQNFGDSWQELNGVWIYELNDEDLLTENYPFSKCFDDLQGEVSEWIEKAIVKVNSIEEKDVPVLFYTIKNKIGWSRWCDVTNGNHYALKEGYNPSDNEVFYCTKSQAEKLGI